MLWRPDPLVEEARKLPDWVAFHQACGRRSLCFDRPVRDGRRYTCLAFTLKRTDQGGWVSIPLGTGRGAGVLDAVFDAYRQAGVSVPEVEGMIERRLSGKPAPVEDDFAALLGDDFEGLLG